MGQGRPAEIRLAETAGFCFGVERAINGAREFAADKDRTNIYCLGELIHNNVINSKLRADGVRIEEDYHKIPEHSHVIIRAHGVSKEVYDYFAKSDIDYIDMTCPFVTRIHKIVSEIPKENSFLLVAGDENHPEVIGICGFAECPYRVFKNAEELKAILTEFSDTCPDTHVYFVSQTTFSVTEWEKCLKIINLLCTSPTVFDTICKATQERQSEAERLSKECDAMVVIGSSHSSNTVKLYNICKENCKTCLIESAKELDANFLDGAKTIGVTAGASTPATTIKGVLETMSEVENKNLNGAEDFEAMLEESLSNMSTDQRVKGVIVGVTPSEIQIDIGRKQTGYIAYTEWSYDPTVDPAEEAKVGDEINVVIMKTNDVEGTIMCSKKRYDSSNSWDELEAAMEAGDKIEGTVTDVIKGGIIATTQKGVRVFIPGSLTGIPKDAPMDELKNTKVAFKIIEVNKQRRRAVGSIKAHSSSARKEAQEAFWAQAEVGQVYTGVVKSLTNYGAFVDIGGVDGMIHISELSWKRIRHPSEILNVGDTVEVFIKSLEDNKISLGYKKDEDNPWVILKNTYSVGDVIDAKIVGMTTFGAFANVIDGIDGLIHISQIANKRIEKPQDVLKVGDTVTVKITEIDYDKKRVSLSIRALLPPEEEPEEEAAPAEETPAEEAPAAEEPAVEEAPVEEPAVEEAPVEEAPAEEPAAEEAPAEEAPAEEPAAEEEAKEAE
ncbi:MAG: bifunctional 4-hydroxy-3-methylbut-2-enyl diphosphate reductase/30S ribosomal protein S1 [Clostridia bacterium]|nr:bifunctional 4-hydroxy-3-methylbut-2-enyl diphosphate reductase/30S ribosomal protein S1 [Clostridia bacterium]